VLCVVHVALDKKEHERSRLVSEAAREITQVRAVESARLVPPPPPAPEPEIQPEPEPEPEPQEEKTMTESLDMASRPNIDTDDDDSDDDAPRRTLAPDFAARAKKLAKRIDRCPIASGRRQYPDDIRIETLQLAKETADAGLTYKSLATVLGIHPSFISQWGKIHHMSTNNTRKAKPARGTKAPRQSARQPAAAPAPAPARAARGGTELERLRAFADSVEALLRVEELGAMEPDAVISALRSAVASLEE
jgi:DNA-binding transcriptional regulator YdaS (Cro superfamily)